MASKVRVNGTNYDVKGGRGRVDGVGYDIKKGRTRVNGTGYDIVLGYEFVIEGSYSDGHQIYLNDVAISVPSTMTITGDDVIKIKGFWQVTTYQNDRRTYFDGDRIDDIGTPVEGSYTEEYHLRIKAHSDLTFVLERKTEPGLGDFLTYVTYIHVTGEYSII